jgi:RNA polymerase sigma-70 factor (ECF subfamily)
MERSQDQELQSLMTRLAEGDRGAFHPVFETLWPVLRRFAARHLPAQEADDAAQEALLKIFHRAARFDADRSALAWALGVTAYEVRTLKRRSQRRREAPEGGTAKHRTDPDPNPEEAAMISDLEATLREHLGALGPADAETLRLYARGETAAVAAATFRKRVERAVRRLRRSLTAERDAPGGDGR